MAKPAHSMIRVLDEEKSLGFYRRGFDLNETDRLVFDDFTLIFLTSVDSAFELELTVNHGVAEPYTHGTGYGHFAVSVDNLEHVHERCSEQQLAPTLIKELYADGKLAVRFFFVTDPDGYQVEVVQRQGRYR